MAARISFDKKNDTFSQYVFEDSYRDLLKNTFDVCVRDTGGEYLVEAELPGIKKEEIDVSIKNGILCISIIREKNAEKNEQCASSTSRSIHLANANPDEIKTKFEYDILFVTIQKQE